MTDRNRNKNQPERGLQQPSSTESQRTSPRRGEGMTDDDMRSDTNPRSTDRDSADDRGLDSDRNRRDFSGEGAEDELDVERGDDTAIDDSDDLDGGRGGPGRSNR
jgi:hypothetical protein